MINFLTPSTSPTALEDAPSLSKAPPSLESGSINFGELVATDMPISVDVPPARHSDMSATALPFIEALPSQTPADAGFLGKALSQDTVIRAEFSAPEKSVPTIGERRPQTDMDAAILPWIETPPAKSQAPASADLPTTILQPAATERTPSTDRSPAVRMPDIADFSDPSTATHSKISSGTAHTDTMRTEKLVTQESDGLTPRLDSISSTKAQPPHEAGPAITAASQTITPSANANVTGKRSAAQRADAALQLDVPRASSASNAAAEATPASHTPQSRATETFVVPAGQQSLGTDGTSTLRQSAKASPSPTISSGKLSETKIQAGQAQPQPEIKFDHVDIAQAPRSETSNFVPASIASLEQTDIPSINPPSLSTSGLAPTGPTSSAPVAAPAAPVPVIPPQAVVGVISGRLVTEPDNSDRIVVQLDPPELGRVAIDFKFDAQGLQTVTITSESPEALKQLRLMHFELVQALEQNGLSGRDLTFAENTSGESQHGSPSNTDASSQDEPSMQTSAEPMPARSTQNIKTESGLDLKL